MDTPDLNHPDLYINRELSLLQFNKRVLEQARDPNTPLLERLKFLCISSTNLDEFFEIRVAGLKQKVESGSVQAGTDNFSPGEILAAISREAHQLVEQQYFVLNEELIPALRERGIRFVRRTHWSETQAEWVRNYFNRELVPVLSPLGLDPAHPFPRILNKSLNFIVSLEGKDAFGRSSGVAIVQAPRSLPRLIPLPSDLAAGEYNYVFLSSIIHAFVDDLFPGMTVTGCYQFRVTRNSDLFVDEEEIDDLMRAMEGELLARRYGDAVRLEVADNCSADMANYLLRQFGLDEADLYQVNGPVNLNRLFAIADLVERPDLKYPPFKPGRSSLLNTEQSIFDTLSRKDILLHHPFESFVPVVEFLRQAAADPDVLAIKQTLYRTGPDSAIVDALVEAARAGKEVTVVVELRARFDEEANIQLANRLQEAGAHVVYGVVGYKTHVKMMLITRREGRGLRHYVHLGTGNYHARTARLYTDYGLLSADKILGEDVHRVFQQLTSLGKVKALRKLLQSPFTLHKELLRKIEREAERAAAGEPARIIAKMNALIEPQVIRALYQASQAGVRIDLIVRGICCLRPGVPGVSDNIQVRSIVGRFLEHTRVFYFRNGGEEEELYLSSADWMDRNFYRRVEIAFPIEQPQLKKQIIKEGLELYLSDNTQAWVLQRDGDYRRLQPTGRQRARSVQATLLDKRAEPA
ncbi:polyphosphate kinase [Thiohalobacter sp. COW1]|uniref:Polyphosphate kinase n=2 Tax=Thiohalobacter TaxID=1273155 RepID=A0A1Z4VTG1_9GAMM|nr:polyphosphate kinase 1 [Thiohalobacter thiocyanaticus]BAZ94929.1 polyphosphate kinase [Thiohalobacter thiocyanaticus]BCO33158.1 polyphosphate kinase [Thiohalobacter sp. COW1]